MFDSFPALYETAKRMNEERSSSRALQLEEALRNLLAQIELHTDCMSGQIEFEALEDFVDEAETLVGALANNTAGIACFDLIYHIYRQRKFSEETFGPGERAQGIVDHIRKELAEILAAPTDLMEWVDVILLAIDGAWRAGYSPEQIAVGLAQKQARNESRKWPDWRTAELGKAIEHIRADDDEVQSVLHDSNPGALR
jgi:hypothetical protein